MSKAKEQYIQQLEYLEFEKLCVTNSIQDIKDCIQRMDDREAEYHQQQLEQQESNNGR
jgi:hypothetical protein